MCLCAALAVASMLATPSGMPAQTPATVAPATETSLRASLPANDNSGLLHGKISLVESDGKQYAALQVDGTGGEVLLGKGLEKFHGLLAPLPVFISAPKNTKGDWFRNVTDIHFRPVGEWRRNLNVLGGGLQKGLEEVTRATVELDNASQKLFADPTEQAVEEFLRQAGTAVEAAEKALVGVQDANTKACLLQYVQSLQADVQDFLRRKRADPDTAAALHTVRTDPAVKNKDFYGVSDNYRPEVYSKVLQRSASAVAIINLVPREVKVGSGALIGKHLVLTCWHCVSARPPVSYQSSQYVVRLSEDQRWADGSQGVDYDCQILCSNPQLDYCLLSLKAQDDADQPVKDHVAALPVMPLTTVPVGFRTPVFVVGFPQGGNLTIHDNSWVLFPHQVVNADRGPILAFLAKSALFPYANPGSAPDITLSNTYKEAQKFAEEQMTLHYGALHGAPDDATAPATHVFDDETYIGLESDTFEGDSGAAVISRSRGTVVGLLRKGMDSGHVASKGGAAFPRQVDSRVHERAIPIVRIIKDIRDQLGEDWTTKHGAKVVK